MAGKKETAIDLSKFIDKGVRVKLSGGREVTGILKGYDQLLNLVLDETLEPEELFDAVAAGTSPPPCSSSSSADPDDSLKVTEVTRPLGLVVLRGTAVMVVNPVDGTEEIANPFVQQDD